VTFYNVAVQIVELVEAESPQEAIQKLLNMIYRVGLEPIEDTADAFESEPLS
jgi:hypothetical protein